MALVGRAYGGETDYTRMRELLVEIYRIAGPPEYATIGDIDLWRFTDDDPQFITHIRLWENEQSKLVGILWPYDGQFDMMVHPHYAELENEILDWTEQAVRRQCAEQALEAGPPVVQTWSYESDHARKEVLQKRGYQVGEAGLVYFLRKLEAAWPSPTLPPGYQIRNVQSEDDLEQRVAVHRDAFTPSKMTVAKHRVVMQAPTYRPELDLVVVAPDGTFAAFCIVWFDQANRLGVFEPVGSHSAHRRLGLTSAMMYEGMRRVKALGAETVCVISKADNAAARGLYSSLGFAELDCNYAWKKLL